ncbi:unnamed protein product [Rotaria socialis]|uniref:FAS1 domain-containing protein n=2 Tax=Rotaria socialis TaxID=392032 RepID=A0A820WSZ4_9BILA|nr:unnamed protein product [Rotaria socialis]CAF4521269.1 unnamed protein product [Rotaria socialis]
MSSMQFFTLFIIIIINCSAGPLDDIANMPDLTLFHQQLIRQQDIQMLLQNIYPQQQLGGMNDFTIFAPNNEAMSHLSGKIEDPNLLWKYHIVPGRYDDQTLYNMAQTKLNEANPRQMIDLRAQNNLPTIALPFQVFYGLGFYGGIGAHVNDSYDNAGYGQGGISWLTHTSLNRTNFLDNDLALKPNFGNNYNQKQNYFSPQSSFVPNNQNLFPPNLTNFYGNPMNPPNTNGQYIQNPTMPNMNYNSYFKQANFAPMGPGANIGLLRPTINNAFILSTRPMSRGIIHVIDHILWPPERRDQTQYKTAYDALEDRQFSRLRQLADRSDFFRSELRSMHHQTWFLPNDQAFASMGSSLSFLFDQFYTNNTNDINEFIRTHVSPLVLFPSSMDSTKKITTLTENKWITFRKIVQPDHSFQVDVICGRYVARILISRSEEIRLYGNGVVYPISTILTSQTRSAADELSQSYQYFMNLVQQSGDPELMSILQGTTNMNMFNPQGSLNITILIPQQISIQQLGNSQELSMHLRRHILRLAVYTDESMVAPATSNLFDQQNAYQTWQQQQQPLMPQQQQPLMPQQQQPLMPQQQQPIMSQQQQPLMPQQQPFMHQQQQPIMPQQQQPFMPQQQQPFMPVGFNQQQFQMSLFQRAGSRSDKKESRRRRQMNIPSGTNFQPQQFPQQQRLPNQQMQPIQQQQMIPVQQQMMPVQQQQQQQQTFHNQQQQQIFPNQQQQQIFPNQQQQQTFPNQQQQILPIQQQQQPMLPTQKQQFNPPNYYPTPSYPSSTIFQHGQVYPTMDPQFSVQAQISTGANGNIVSLVGRTTNSLPFTATILNSESNIRVKNGVMHVVHGIVSGMMVPLEGILTSIQGTSGFAQLLQQTRVIEQLKQSGLPYTLFIPTNAALQSIGSTTNVNQLRQFVLRHICADILLDPMSNVLRRSGGFYNRNQNIKIKPQRTRRRRQDWTASQRNQTNTMMMMNRQGLQQSSGLGGSGYYQPQQQTYGNYPAAAPSFGSNNNPMYNPGYVMNGYASQKPEVFPGYYRTYSANKNFNYNHLAMVNQPISNPPWNTTKKILLSPQVNSLQRNGPQNSYVNPNVYAGGPTYASGPQSCIAMTGDRITVQSLAGTLAEVNPPSMSYQNYIVTCCGDLSVNAMVQSFNIYPPNFAVYLIGQTLLSQGKTINTMHSRATKLASSHMIFIFFIISLILKRTHQF